MKHLECNNILYKLYKDGARGMGARVAGALKVLLRSPEPEHHFTSEIGVRILFLNT